MTQRTLKLHGTLTIACLGFVASMAACLGDDSTEGPRPDAAGTADHAVTADSPTPDNSSPQPDSSTTPDTSVTPDARPDVSVGDGATPDGGVRDSAPDARDSAPDVPRESAPESAAPETGSPDVVADRAAEATAPEAAPPDAAPEGGGNTALHMCQRMDASFNISTDAGACTDATGTGCPDRSTTWASPITDNFTFFGPIGMDCRIADMFTAPGADFLQFTLDLTSWSLGFFGCPADDTPNPLPFGLVVTGLQDQVLTTADLRLLSDYYLIAVDQALSDASAAALTPTEINQMNARLDALAAARPNTVQANTYTFDSCPADAGSQ